MDINSYKIEEDDRGRKIVCVVCGMASHNPNDIKYKYCGYCHKFHTNLTQKLQKQLEEGQKRILKL